jgi:MOSC domain-containing protein YiiM
VTLIQKTTESFPRPGRLESIGIASAKLVDLQSLETATLQPGTGIQGEHHAVNGHSKREVTLIQHEHFPIIAQLAGLAEVTPELLSRNLVVSGINLLALKRGMFRIGNVLLEGTGICAPCSRMEQNLGAGGYNAMRGHGGITACVIEGGEIHVGDELTAVTGFEPREGE